MPDLERTPHNPTTRLAVPALLAGLLALGAAASPAAGQQPAGRASTSVTVSATIRPVLSLVDAAAGSLRFSAREAVVSSALTVRGNVAYELRLRRASPVGAGQVVEVRAGAASAWRPLPPDEVVAVGGSRALGVTTQQVECRVRGDGAPRAVAACTLAYEIVSLDPASSIRSTAVLPVPAASVATGDVASALVTSHSTAH